MTLQLDPINLSSPKGIGKWFKLTGVQINEVKVSSKALKGK